MPTIDVDFNYKPDPSDEDLIEVARKRFEKLMEENQVPAVKQSDLLDYFKAEVEGFRRKPGEYTRAELIRKTGESEKVIDRMIQRGLDDGTITSRTARGPKGNTTVYRFANGHPRSDD